MKKQKIATIQQKSSKVIPMPAEKLKSIKGGFIVEDELEGV